jgi:excisionase family DNA binding protein
VDDKLLSVEDLAEYLQLSTKTVYRMLRRGDIPCYRVGNQWRFRKEAIDAWLENDEPMVEAGDEAR